MKHFLSVLAICFLLSACQKEPAPQQTPCTQTGMQALTLTNGFTYAVDIKGNRLEGSEVFGYIIQPGKKYTFTVKSGTWNITAHWDDGHGPYAHNSGDFNSPLFKINDCDPARIEYPF